MKTGVFSFGRVCVILAMLWTLALSGLSPATAQVRTDAEAPATSDPTAALIFIENTGQFPDGALFQVRGRDLSLWLAEDAIWLTVFDQTTMQSPTRRAGNGNTSTGSPPSPGKGVNIKLSFPGANPHPRLEPFTRLETRVSFFTGSDPAKWQADVPAWGGVRYVDLYPGIDLELTGEQGQLVPRLSAQPGANLDAVRLRVEGADTVVVEGDMLRIGTAAGKAAYTVPVLRVKDSTAEADVQSHGSMEFEISAPFAPEDLDQPTAPVPNGNPADLLYSTFLGGNNYDHSHTIALDASGAAYLAGYTLSADFPTTPGAFDTSYDGTYRAGFVAKLNVTSSALEYATFLDGSGHDHVTSIAVDESGAAYVTGYTDGGWPTTPGAFDTTFAGECKAFATKLNPAGSALVYSTYLGGDGWNEGRGIVVDGSGAAYVAGSTNSSDLPVTTGAYDTSFNGELDVFLVKVAASGSELSYSTYLGGSSYDDGLGLAVDGSGAAYVTGWTQSDDLPTTPGAFDTTFTMNDGFVLKVNAAGSDLEYSTFLGGSGGAGEHLSIAVDRSGAAYVTGETWSEDFPTTPGAFDTSFNGYSDTYVVKLNAAGSALEYGTFLGGTEREVPRAIAVDGSGAVYLTGRTASPGFPVTPDAFDTSLGGGYYGYDGFVAKLSADGSALRYATYLGGSNDDSGEGIALGALQTAYVTGYTGSPDFPTTPGAYDTTPNGFDDSFLVRLNMDPMVYAYAVYLPMVHRNSKPSDLLYSTYLGGSASTANQYDRGWAIAVDSSGAAYITGWTYSSDFPTTPGAFDTSLNGWADVIVVKLNADGSALAYATFLGGSGYTADWGAGITVDESGAAYVTGQTVSPDFPTTPGAFDTIHDNLDAFVTKLNPAGSDLEYSTFLGGGWLDEGWSISVDGSGAAYVTGETESPDWPATTGAFDSSYNGGDGDAFVAKLNVAGTALEYGTFLGGSAWEAAYAITVDGDGRAYVTGTTVSTDWPVTPGCFDSMYRGEGDVFVTRLNADGSALAYSTYLGGSTGEGGTGIAVDGSGAAYVTGWTQSADLPTTSGAFDTSYNDGGIDAFVAKLDTAGSALEYATYLGGSNYDEARGVAVDESGAAYVAGGTESDNFPTTPGAFDTSANGYSDAFVVKLSVAGSALEYGTFLGALYGDYAHAIALDGSGAAYITGYTYSPGFPTTQDAYDTSYNGGDADIFVSKLMVLSPRSSHLSR